MPRAPALLLGAAGVLLTAGLTAFVTLGGSLGAWASVAAGALVAAVGFGLGTRWARAHVPGLKTFAMELAEQRDACLELRGRLKRQHKAHLALKRQRRQTAMDAGVEHPLEPWETWRTRINEWDSRLWPLLQRRLPDLWRVYRRENPVIPAHYGDEWSRDALAFLEGRWQLLKTLSEREHDRAG